MADFKPNLPSLIEMIGGLKINQFNQFSEKSVAFRRRLMDINIRHHEHIVNNSGRSSMRNGDSAKINTDKLSNPEFVFGRNYTEFAENISDQEDKGINSTRSVTNQNNTNNSYTNHINLYGTTNNLYPDERNVGEDNFKDSDKWKIEEDGANSILRKTRDLFRQNKIRTIISAFHTKNTENAIGDNPPGSINDNKTTYGLSHGRNLLTEKAEKENKSYSVNGYDNPYCRVWTHHYQYDKYDKLIRPFYKKDSEGENSEILTPQKFHKWNQFDTQNDNYGERKVLQTNVDGTTEVISVPDKWGWKSDENKGWQKSVFNKTNGLINIAPKYLGGGKNNIHTKDCMFSIENLAWKGYDPYSFEKALSWEQRGPNGGRIMWFPPYGIKFSEQTTTRWNANTFIGRGEDVYTYVNTVRQGTLSFMLVVDHPSIIDYVSHNKKNVDKVSDTDLLRFFAGCDGGKMTELATPTDLTDEWKDNKVVKEAEIKPQKEELPPPPPEPEVHDPFEISFYVFYPNNYSGCFDINGEYAGESNSQVEAMAYLLNGYGAQKTVSADESLPTEDVPLTFENLDDYDNGIGYEMGGGGISIGISDDNVIKGTDKPWSSIATLRPERTIYKVDKNIPRTWKYRTDGRYIGKEKSAYYSANTFDQRLVTKTNYEDTESHGLNCNVEKVKQVWGEEATVDNLYSFAQIAAALAPTDVVKTRIVENSRSNITDGDEYKKLEEILGKDSNYQILSIKADGFSNSHGSNKSSTINKSRNDSLAIHRAKSVGNWLKGLLGDRFKDKAVEYGKFKSSQQVAQEDKNRVSGISSKKFRCARVIIKVQQEATVPVSETNQVDEVTPNEGIQEDSQFVGYMLVNSDKGIYQSEDGRFWKYNVQSGQMVLYTKEDAKNDNFDEKLLPGEAKLIERLASRETQKNRIRYDQEYHFFKQLKETDDVIFEKLMDKIQYFDPAFHSMTPEGFSARLTFLQQCTRQGNTVGASDYDGKSANNLAFGRPPFCILRLGDFYHQMVVIENISFDFDTLVWDLNTENAGVIPMLCTVNMSFKFIGGGDMGGAIRRLQNAMSFNYYANTSLYDNRADRVEYDENWDEKSAQNTSAKWYFYETQMKK